MSYFYFSNLFAFLISIKGQKSFFYLIEAAANSGASAGHYYPETSQNVYEHIRYFSWFRNTPQ